MNFVITNTVRRPQTRVHRAMAPTRARSTQRICGNKFRLVRGKNRPGITIDEDLMLAHWNELEAKQLAGLIAVHVDAYNGPLFDFSEDARAEMLDRAGQEPKEGSDDESEDEEPAADDPEEETEEPEEAPEKEELEPEEEVTPEPEKPVERMNKAELVAHAAVVLGEEEADLEALTKRQIMERLG